MRGILFGLVLLPVFAIGILSFRPGGLREQLRLAARRFRIALVLGGIYLVASTAARVVLGERPEVDYGLAALAAGLAVVFVVLAQDPKPARR